MLRGIGYSLITTGALGVFAASHAITYLLLGWPYVYGLLGLAYSGAFAACGIAVSVLLIKRKPVSRDPLFWIALLGICMCTPLALLHITRCFLWALQEGNALVFIPMVLLGNAHFDGWWPPQEVLFLDTLMHAEQFRQFAESFLWYGKPLHEPLLWIGRVASSATLWIYLPIALCLWVMRGRRGAWTDRACSLGALFLATLVMTSALETGWVHYQQWSLKPGQGEVYDFLYVPRLSWYVFYAIAVLWLVAFAALLSRNRTHASTLSSLDDSPSE